MPNIIYGLDWMNILASEFLSPQSKRLFENMIKACAQNMSSSCKCVVLFF